MATLPLLPETSDDPVVASVFDRLKQRWGTVLNLYRVLGWSPELVRSWAAFAWSLRFETKASRRLRELMVTRIAQSVGAKYEYEHHLHMAEDEGITASQIEALADWQSSDSFSDDERLVLRLADEIALESQASPETMVALRSTFSERDTVELLVTACFYRGVGCLVNSLQLELEPNHSTLRARDS